MITVRYFTISILFAVLGAYSPHIAEGETKTKLLHQQNLSGFSGKEGMILTVRFPPGESSPVHRHNAHIFIYILEGSVIFQLEGGQPVTLKAGETFYESPKDIHIVSKNASTSLEAKIIVFFIKDKGALPLLPVK